MVTWELELSMPSAPRSDHFDHNRLSRRSIQTKFRGVWGLHTIEIFALPENTRTVWSLSAAIDWVLSSRQSLISTHQQERISCSTTKRKSLCFLSPQHRTANKTFWKANVRTRKRKRSRPRHPFGCSIIAATICSRSWIRCHESQEYSGHYKTATISWLWMAFLRKTTQPTTNSFHKIRTTESGVNCLSNSKESRYTSSIPEFTMLRSSNTRSGRQSLWKTRAAVGPGCLFPIPNWKGGRSSFLSSRTFEDGSCFCRRREWWALQEKINIGRNGGCRNEKAPGCSRD